MEEGFTTVFPILTFLNLHKSIFYPWNRESRCKIVYEKVNHAPLCSLKSKQFQINFQCWEKTKSTNFVRKHNMIRGAEANQYPISVRMIMSIYT